MNLYVDLKVIRVGFIITILTLMFGIGLGIVFGANEEMVKNYIHENVVANPTVHDAKSEAKIWRYAQRAHFHADGIAAYSLALIILVLLSKMKDNIKSLTATLIGVGTLYPFVWFVMFLLSPIIGRNAAHAHILTESIAYLSVGGGCFGILLLCGSLFFNLFNKPSN